MIIELFFCLTVAIRAVHQDFEAKILISQLCCRLKSLILDKHILNIYRIIRTCISSKGTIGSGLYLSNVAIQLYIFVGTRNILYVLDIGPQKGIHI